MENNLVPDIEIMKKVIEIRKEPNKYKDNDEVMKWTETLGEYIQRFADVLEKEIENKNLESNDKKYNLIL